jgi:hypothetical protein
MMMGMGRKRGIFGGGFDSMDLPSALPSMSQIPTTAGGMYGDSMPAQQQRKPGLGTRLLGEGWEGKLSALGGALQGDYNAIPQYMQGQDIMRARAEQQAAAQREQAQFLAGAQGVGLSPQQAQLLGPEGVRQYTLGQLKPKEPVQPRFEQDNAGNVWALDPMTGRPMSDRPVFVDNTPRETIINGAVVRMPNQYATQQGGGAPTRPVGRLTPIPNAQAAPAQRLVGPRVISKAEYDAQLRQFGGDQLSMNAWMRNNNVIAD